MADTPKHSVSVAGVVIDDQEQVLVIQRRDNGHWEPPGGVLELAETPEAGVKREVLEETGIEVEVQGLSGVYKNMSRGVVALVFRCRPVTSCISTSDETRRVTWATLDGIKGMMSEAYSVRIADAFEDRVATRNHDGQTLLDTLSSATTSSK